MTELSALQGVVAGALKEHRSQLEAVVRARVQLNDVEDVLQLAAIRAIERAGSLKDPLRVLPWLKTLHRNITVDFARQHSSESRWLSADAEIPELASEEPDEVCHCSRAQVQQLPPNYRSILTLVDMEELSLAEAAQRLGVSVNNVSVRLHRARKALREQMLQHCGVSSLHECLDCRCVHEGCCPV